MPTAIPFDPSLVLGSIVHQEIMQNLLDISKVQAPIDAAQDSLNSLIAVRRSLDMTVQELVNLNVDTKDIVSEIGKLNQEIVVAGKDYAKTWVDNVEKIKELKSKQQAVHEDYESPLDYNQTQIKKMPLSADSLKLEAQYFSFDDEQQSAQNTVSDIKSFISNSTGELGAKFSGQASAAVTRQMNSQLETHDISGTVVISVTCTHKDAVLLAPLILDVDKGIRVWNQIFTNEGDKIKTDSPSSIQSIATKSGTNQEKSFSIISGATYGSCFIGMVHTLKSDSTKSSQSMSSMASSIQSKFQAGKWFASESGSFGVDSSFANDIKNLLSTQTVTSHVSLVTMGSIPSIKSNTIKLGVTQFADFDPASMMTKLNTMAQNTATNSKTPADAANKAQAGAQLLSIQNSTVSNVMLGLAKVDDGANKLLDINSMMTAFDDYIDKCIAGNIGVPINYYIKPITQSQLAEMWVAKYYPGQYLSISGDDSARSGGAAAANSGASASSGSDSSSSAGSGDSSSAS